LEHREILSIAPRSS
jgi:hypothetical protein